MNPLIMLGGAFACLALAAHLASIAVVLLRFRKDDCIQDDCAQDRAQDVGAPVSILRPVCGVENFIEETLESAFVLDYPRYEIVFCVADKDDPVIPMVRRLIAAYPAVEARLLTGHADVSGNPKLNNLVKGWHDSRNPWAIMADSNVLMPRDYIRRMRSAWRADTGLVCSPPVGARPENFWAELECMFLNTYQARWQCFADSIGLAFAQGKSLLWRRELLDAAGGIEALARDVAEDAAATKIVRAKGLRVRLVSRPFVQPLGYRRAMEVWNRQLRWARLRRRTFPWFFLPELAVGAVPPLALASMVAISQGWPVIATIVPLAVAWYAAEACLARAAGWDFSLRSILACILRDLLLPLLWLWAWAGNNFEWRGNLMTVAFATAPESGAALPRLAGETDGRPGG
jgi:ceramide glucosyltransferase